MGECILTRRGGDSFTKIKKEGLTATNLVINGEVTSATSWYSSYGTVSYSNGELIVTFTSLPPAGSSAVGGYEALSQNTITGHKYYMGMSIYPLYNCKCRFGLGGVFPYLTDNVANVWNSKSIIITATGVSGGFDFMSDISTCGYSIGQAIKFKHLKLIDLTQTFGAGNEPTTTAECEKYFTGYFSGTQSAFGTFKLTSGTDSIYMLAPPLKSNATDKDEISWDNGYKMTQRIDTDGTTLATPIITPIPIVGNSDRIFSGATISPHSIFSQYYTTKISIPNTAYPIKNLLTIFKGATELNIVNATVAGDKLSFTHTGLAEGDLVHITYEHNGAVTNTVEYE